jgi:hypothetical protein
VSNIIFYYEETIAKHVYRIIHYISPEGKQDLNVKIIKYCQDAGITFTDQIFGPSLIWRLAV